MKPLKIAYIRYHLREPATGIGNVCKNFELELSKYNDVQLIGLTPPPISNKKGILKIINKAWFVGWLKFAVPFLSIIKGADVYVEMNMLYPLFRFAKFYFFIYDLAFVKMPEVVLNTNYNKRVSFLKRINGQKDKNIAISESTRRDFLEYTGVPPSTVDVVYLDSSMAVDPVTDGRAVPTTPYFLFVGTLEPRKNVTNLVRAFYSFSEQVSEEYHLYLIGKKGWLYEEIFKTIDEKPHLKDRIKWIGYASDQELSFYYMNAFALLYPSLYEGFGLPILEAMRHGLPVISTNNSSLGEVGGDAVLYCDSIEAPGILRPMLQLHREPGLRDKLIRKGYERAGLFSWKQFGDTLHTTFIQNR
ncbi:glycosyltransferase family 1 protein [Chitinophaga sp. LS1]|uniref:glycosyltransferase family 4 protein n=1 Tax=Chitinophaga sp. LS1 TaxID=3051176 RepID=UPI002AAAB091|nr:glycosyltransferase family 1 protein [Chitinophaga sp. LS1]WPV68985.1 glycosyltransferase family 1 protein [Chitinophaga sp. LS1]